MANTAFGHDATLTTPGSTTDTALVRWANTSGTSLNNTINILSDGSNITLNARGEVRFSDADSSHYIAFESPATVGTSYTMTLPADLPAADEVLTVTSYSGGAGVLEWAAAGGGTTGTTDNGILTFVNSGSTFAAESTLTFNGTTLSNSGSGTRQITNHITASSGTDSIVMISMAASNNGVVYLGLHEGVGDGSSGNMGYRVGYDSNGNVFRIQSRDWNGSGGAGAVVEIPDGTPNLKLPAGNLIIGTAGKGIDFSAQTASSTGTVSSEVLDHYEEGTFTPSFADAWNAGAGSYANRVGYYTKIGNMVYASGFVALSSISGLTGGNHARVVGLPFANHSASSAETAAFVGQCGGLAIAQYASITGGFGAGQSGFLLYLWDATGGTTNLSITELSASGSIRFEVSYRV